MSIYTSLYLKGVKEKTTLSESQRLFSQGKAQTAFDIFLAHSFLDKDEVEGLYYDLTNKRFSVYVDWIVDPQLERANVTKESATLVRNRLRSSKAVLLAISVNTTISKWVPWELGYGDGNTSNCAIIPVTKNDIPPKSYARLEYLSLYPYVSRRANQNNIMRLWVVEKDDTFVLLENFILGEKPYLQNVKIY